MLAKLKKLYLGGDQLTKDEKLLIKLRVLNDFENFKHFFLSKKIDPNFSDLKGNTILMLCINANLSCSLDYAVFLLESGADINRQDNSGRTALLMACHWGESDLLDIFLSYKPDLNMSTYLDRNDVFPINPLVSLIFKENYELAQKIVLKGACPFIAERIFERYPNKSEKQLKMLENYKRWKYGKHPLLLARLISQKTKKGILNKLPEQYFQYIITNFA